MLFEYYKNSATKNIYSKGFFMNKDKIQSTKKTCMHCGNKINITAIKCRFCGQFLKENTLGKEFFFVLFAVWMVLILFFFKNIYADFFVNKGIELSENGNIKGSVYLIQSGISINKNEKNKYFNLIENTILNEAANGEKNRTFNLLRTSISVNKQAPSYYINLLFNAGEKSIKEKNYEKAINYFDILIALNKNNYKAYSERGYAKSRLNKLNEAINDFNKAIFINKNFTTAYQYRADIYLQKKEYKNAVNDYEKILKLKNDPKIKAKKQYALGYLYLEQKQYRESMDNFWEATSKFKKLKDNTAAEQAQKAFDYAANLRCEYGDYCY